MKQTLHISIDEDLVKKLREEMNYSNIIEKLIREFYEGNNTENLAKLKEKQSENKQILKEKRRELKEINKKIVILEQKEKKILSISHGFSSKQLNLLKTVTNIFMEWRGIRSEFGGFSLSEVTKVWQSLKGGAI